jgi:hypothetical protein
MILVIYPQCQLQIALDNLHIQIAKICKQTWSHLTVPIQNSATRQMV